MDKSKRTKRFEQKKRHIDRQVDIMKLAGFDNSKGQPHRYHKKSALNCGNPNCVMCGNPRKMFGEETFQEKKFKAVAIDE